MRNANVKKGLLIVSVASMLALGCELVVDFDRSKIPSDGTDATVIDAAVADVSIDTSLPDTGTTADASTDAAGDAAVDADASTDAAGDADAN